MKKINRIISGILVCSFSLSNISCYWNRSENKGKLIAKAEKLLSDDGYSYSVTNNGIIIEGYSKGDSNIIIPDSIDSKH